MATKKGGFKVWRRLACEAMPCVEPILYACRYIEDEEAGIGTFCIEPATLTVKYNPKFAAKNTDQHNAYILAHEAGHFLCRHADRAKAMLALEGKEKFQPQLFMIAEEVAVNHLVSSLTGWPVPEGGTPPFPECKALTTEEIYHKLRRIASKLPKMGFCPGHGDGEMPQSGAAALLSVQAQEQAGKILQKQAEEGKLAGSEVGELRELAVLMSELKKPIDWKEKLRRYLTALDTNCKEFDPRCIYRRPMMLGSELVMPNLASSPTVKRAGVSVDNSGSVDDAMFGGIVGVLNDFAKKVGFNEMLVYHFTSEVIKRERYTNLKELAHFKRQGSGGTCVLDADRQAKRDGCQFNIILTDGYVCWPQQFSVPTLIVLTVKDNSDIQCGNLIGVVEAVDE